MEQNSKKVTDGFGGRGRRGVLPPQFRSVNCALVPRQIQFSGLRKVLAGRIWTATASNGLQYSRSRDRRLSGETTRAVAYLFGYTRSVACLLLSCMVARGQWRILCSAVWLHEDVSGGSSAQLFGYTRMAVAYHTQLFDYTRITVADVQRCFVLHLTFQAQTPSRPSLF